MDKCAECGFAYDPADIPEVGTRIRESATSTAALLTGDDLHPRRTPEVWSPLEYACHLRDVFLVLRERFLAIRRRDMRDWTPMGRDERVDHDGYADQAPAAVARQLLDAAEMFSNVLARTPSEDLALIVRYPYPEPTERTLGWVALHTLHEARHHHLDITRQLS
ncbi:DinB family protein [Actinokineospora sp. NBRC 105648]|uniref:DinB family protein n=1 Tax=Actinokineospora sp. NBRC 105648 TaxID=3032206 RepID=UPI0025543946|nr:DinB family protein [Actinokineospora sp. NBRC 105648]